jgi:alcohol dehydrogenase class IV
VSARGDWSYPTAVRFGAGRIAELPEALRAVGISRPLLVTDAGLAGLPITARVLEILGDAGSPAALFAGVQPNPVAGNVEEGVEALRAGGHDGVIAFGGGSGLDVGKVVAFMAGQRRPLGDFEDRGDAWKEADAAGILPVVAVPTTAGTGSEVGRAGVITDQASHTKRVIFHPRMLPREVILDPELTVGLPPAITVGTGFDALAHCLEAYCAPACHPLADGIALEGARLALENLFRVWERPGDLEARGQMMSAALMGATAFQKGLGAVHALAHPLGALHDTHHGMTNAVLLPYVLQANRGAVEERLGRLAAYCGLGPSSDALLEAILKLREDLEVPHTLTGLGITAEHRERIGRMAVADPTAAGNPVPLTEELALEIFDRALEGRLQR